MRTELPEKWFIIITEENRAIVKSWFLENICPDSTQEFSLGYEYCNYLIQEKTFCVCPNKITDVKLTFEEFKTLVLNKNNEPQYEIY